MRPVNLRPLWHKAKASGQVFPHDSSFRMPLQRESFCAMSVHFCRVRNEELRVAIATTVFPAASSCHCHELCTVIAERKTETMASAGSSKICRDKEFASYRETCKCIFNNCGNSQILKNQKVFNFKGAKQDKNF